VVGVTRPAVVVRGVLPDPVFRVNGEEHRVYGGMSAQVDVAVRSQSLLVRLVPGLADLRAALPR
jgi:hypothetical protein